MLTRAQSNVRGFFSGELPRLAVGPDLPAAGLVGVHFSDCEACGVAVMRIDGTPVTCDLETDGYDTAVGLFVEGWLVPHQCRQATPGDAVGAAE